MSDNARFKIKYTGTVLEVERDFPSGIQSEVGPEVRKPLASRSRKVAILALNK